MNNHNSARVSNLQVTQVTGGAKRYRAYAANQARYEVADHPLLIPYRWSRSAMGDIAKWSRETVSGSGWPSLQYIFTNAVQASPQA